MAELADALDSGSSEFTLMQVQVLLSAPIRKDRLLPVFSYWCTLFALGNNVRCGRVIRGFSLPEKGMLDAEKKSAEVFPPRLCFLVPIYMPTFLSHLYTMNDPQAVIMTKAGWYRQPAFDFYFSVSAIIKRRSKNEGAIQCTTNISQTNEYSKIEI